MRFEDVVNHFGSQAAIARALDVKTPSVAEWKKNGVPAKRQMQLEKLTGGALKAHPRVRNEFRALVS